MNLRIGGVALSEYGTSSQDEPHSKIPRPSNNFLGETTRWDMVPDRHRCITKNMTGTMFIPVKKTSEDFFHAEVWLSIIFFSGKHRGVGLR